MSKRAWGPIALPAIGIAALGVVAWGAIYQPQCHRVLKTLSQQSAEAPKTAYEGSVTCERDCQVTFGLAPNSKNEPGDGTTKQTHTCDTTEELDLVQQTVMAHWAFVSALLAMLGLFGVLYTFREAHKLGKLQSRAYLSIPHTEVCDLREGKQFRAMVRLKNTGQTLARDMRVKYTTAYITIPTDRDILKEAPRPSPSSPQSDLGTGSTITIHPTHGFPLDAASIANIKDGREAIIVIIKVDYVDIFGERHSDDFPLACYRDSAKEGVGLSGYSAERIAKGHNA